MKNKILLTLLIIFIQVNANAQNTPIWSQTMNVSPSPDYLFPEKTKVDINGNVIVLSTQSAQTVLDQKIYLKKFDTDGNTIWSITFDNLGINNPRGFDMAIDSAGNIYVAGALMTNDIPLLIKFNASGIFQWQTSSFTAFPTGGLQKVIWRNGLLYLQSTMGVGVCDDAGNEQWSAPGIVSCMDVDWAGRIVAAVYNSTETLIRYNTDGSVSFRDSTIFTGKKIAIDYFNNISIVNDLGMYEVASFDSSGALKWIADSLAEAPPFGDIGLDLLTDYDMSVIAVGLNDTIYKFNSFGNLLWKKPMNDLDGYSIQASIADNNFILVSGVTNGFSGYDLKVTAFDLLGNEFWSGQYNSNITQEFSVDHANDLSGIYVLEDSISNSTLVKFDNPFAPTGLDFSLICVDSVWYDTLNPIYINIRVFNGNSTHMNYPSVQMVSPQGDTISNQYNLVNFFAHLGNTLQTYQDTISIAGIQDFSDYHFLMSDGFGDTTVEIGFCLTSGIADPNATLFNVYPNPATGIVHIMDLPNGVKYDLQIFDTRGKCCYTSKVDDNNSVIDLESLSSGLYILRLSNKSGIRYGKVVVQ